MLKILVEEEYGYRYWVWHYPGTTSQLIEDWQKGRAPLDFMDPSKKSEHFPFSGEMARISDEEAERMRDERNEGNFIFAHVHMVDDSFLLVGDKRFPHPKVDG